MPGRLNQKAFIILGTDTGVGKTVLAAGLLRAYARAGFIAFPQKWVSTGDRFGFSEDMSFALDAADIEKDVLVSNEVINPYSFVMPASPHFAAKVQNKSISMRAIAEKFSFAKLSSERLVVEGVGGLFVPLNNRVLLIDLVEKLKLPIVLVAKNVLGAINHSLLSIEALRIRKIKIVGIVFNNAFTCPANIKQDNIRVICNLGKVKKLGIMPYMGYIKDHNDVFDSIMLEVEKNLK